MSKIMPTDKPNDMKRYIISLISIAAAIFSTAAQTAESTQFFELPKIPAEKVNLQDRTDYLLEHYWDFCDLDKAFSSRDKMAEAFDTYISLMPIASAQVVYQAVPEFMKKISKKPANVLFIGELAEAKLYSDTAQFPSDELFILFADEIVKNKKVDKNSKLRYEHLARVLSSSMPGAIAPRFEYTDLLGNKGAFEVDTTRTGTILFFNDPDCDDCNRARLRLDTDILTRRMIENKVMDLVSVYASDASPEWMEKAMDNPKEWKTIASEQVNDLYDLRTTPMFYVINPNGAILLKTPDVNAIINIMATLSDHVANRAPASTADE